MQTHATRVRPANLTDQVTLASLLNYPGPWNINHPNAEPGPTFLGNKHPSLLKARAVASLWARTLRFGRVPIGRDAPMDAAAVRGSA